MRIRKKIALTSCTLVFFLLLSCFSIGQSVPVFTMSSVGIIGNTKSNASAISFTSNAACIDVQTGIAVLSGTRANGQFVVNCNIPVKFNTLGIKLFPNPVTTTTKVKFLNTPPLTENFSLTVWTMEGTKVISRTESGYNIYQGVIVDMSKLFAGTYIIKIESANYVDAIKFIKAN